MPVNADYTFYMDKLKVPTHERPPPLLLSHFHILPCGWPMNDKQHGRIWKWIQGNLEMYMVLVGGIDTSPVEKITDSSLANLDYRSEVAF